MQDSFIRHGVGAVRSYIHGPLSLPQFLRDVFGAIELGARIIAEVEDKPYDERQGGFRDTGGEPVVDRDIREIPPGGVTGSRVAVDLRSARPCGDCRDGA